MGTLRIDAYFDFICPWCLIGKRQLERALTQLRASHPEVELELAWHGVQLLPHLPAQGVPFVEFYQKRLGSAEAVRVRQAQVRQAAAAVGLSIDFSSINTMPNTADAHRLLECATELGSVAQRDALLEGLFAAYFHLGEDLADSATLLAIAESCGYPRAALADCLEGLAAPTTMAEWAPGGAVFHLQPSSGGVRCAAGRAAVASDAASPCAGRGLESIGMSRRIAVPAEKVPALGKRSLFEPEGSSLALFNVAGQLYAIDDSCPHQGPHSVVAAFRAG